MRFAVDKETMGQFSLRVHRFFPLPIPLPFIPLFFIYSLFVPDRQMREAWEPFKK